MEKTERSDDKIDIIYNDTDIDLYIIHIIPMDNDVKRLFPMTIGRMIHDLKIEGIRKIKQESRRCILVEFAKASQANSIIDDARIKAKNLKVIIPSKALFLFGLIRGVDVDLSSEQIIDFVSSPFPIVHARRLNRRVVDDKGQVNYVPTKSVDLKFRFSKLPAHVYMFSISLEVSTYVPAPRVCVQCLRYGHTQKFCRGKARCTKCGGDHVSNECSKILPICASCGTNHVFNHPDCSERSRQFSICQMIHLDGLSFSEAIKLVPSNKSKPSTHEKDAIDSLLLLSKDPTSQVKHFVTKPLSSVTNQRVMYTGTSSPKRKLENEARSAKSIRTTKSYKEALLAPSGRLSTVSPSTNSSFSFSTSDGQSSSNFVTNNNCNDVLSGHVQTLLAQELNALIEKYPQGLEIINCVKKILFPLLH